MALSLISRLAPSAEALALRTRVASRALSIEKTIGDRERAAESVFFAKEERDLLKKLAKKMGMPSKEMTATEESDIKKIFAKHSVEAKPALISEIQQYFHTHPH
jgi:hypothetical protein